MTSVTVTSPRFPSGTVTSRRKVAVSPMVTEDPLVWLAEVYTSDLVTVDEFTATVEVPVRL